MLASAAAFCLIYQLTFDFSKPRVSCPRLPPEHEVDVLVVSAFKEDYLETSGSLIGALGRKGLSLSDLASRKQIDMREQFSSWLSQPVPARFNFRRVLCIESGWRGEPPEITDDLFRALSPLLLTDFPDSSVAMPLIGAGDQGWPADEMLEAILLSTVGWIERGLKLRVLKIVVFDANATSKAVTLFEKFRTAYTGRTRAARSARSEAKSSQGYDVFISYSHTQAEIANTVCHALQSAPTRPRIFLDSTRLNPGASWPTELAAALDSSRRVLALYSPAYWASPVCQLEFNAALARQLDTGLSILFPLFLEEVQIPYLFRTIQYTDCRVNDVARVKLACQRVVASLKAAVG